MEDYHCKNCKFGAYPCRNNNCVCHAAQQQVYGHQEREECKCADKFSGNKYICMCKKSHPEPNWEISFDKEFDSPMAQWTSVAIKSFIYSLLATQEEKIRKEIDKQIILLVAEECNTARSDGQSTSRLTSLAMKALKIINEGIK